MANSKQSLNTFRQLAMHHFSNMRLVRKDDVVAVLKRAGVQQLDRGLLKQAIEVAGHAPEISRQLDRMLSDDGVITLGEAIDLFHSLGYGTTLDRKTLEQAVEEAGKVQQETNDDRVLTHIERDLGARDHRSHIPLKASMADVDNETEYTVQDDVVPLQTTPKKVVVQESAVQTIEPHAIPMRDGKIIYTLLTEPSETLVVHCADPRFQEAFRLFITEGLGIRHYTPVVLGGGVHAFGTEMLLPKNFKVLWQQIKFFVKEAKIKRIIFINHDDCQWYKKMKTLRPKLGLTEQEVGDLGTAARRILDDFGGVDVKTFFAKIVNTNEVEFQEIA